MATDTSSWLGRLPTELIDIISSWNDGTMPRAEAEQYRLELMGERTVFIQESDSNYFGQGFNMWYVLVYSPFSTGSLKLWISASTEVPIHRVLLEDFTRAT